VLTGTIMPSILTEISFVSSPRTSTTYRAQPIASESREALYQGIARYQASAPHAKIAQLPKGIREINPVVFVWVCRAGAPSRCL